MPTWHEQLSGFCQDEGLVKALCPPARGTNPWQPTSQDVALAWIVYTELRTRIATQPLPSRDGIEATALKSLVGLFPLWRRSLAYCPQARHTTAPVVHCLNEHIRTLTARWHPLPGGWWSSVNS